MSSMWLWVTMFCVLSRVRANAWGIFTNLDARTALCDSTTLLPTCQQVSGWCISNANNAYMSGNAPHMFLQKLCSLAWSICFLSLLTNCSHIISVPIVYSPKTWSQTQMLGFGNVCSCKGPPQNMDIQWFVTYLWRVEWVHATNFSLSQFHVYIEKVSQSTLITQITLHFQMLKSSRTVWQYSHDGNKRHFDSLIDSQQLAIQLEEWSLDEIWEV